MAKLPLIAQALLGIALLSPVMRCQTQATPSRTISFQGLKSSPKRCHTPFAAQFIDNSTLLLTNPICARSGSASSYQYAVVNLDGTIRSTIELSESSNRGYVGPPGYLFFPADHRGWLIYDTDLQPKWNVPIPEQEFPGSVILSLSHTAAAISSDLPGDHLGQDHWQLFMGEPLAKVGEYTGRPPFPGVSDIGTIQQREPNQPSPSSVQPIEGEFWFFNPDNLLSRRTATTPDLILREAEWLVPKSQYPPHCFTSLSISPARKILAYCSSEVHLPRGFALLIHTYMYSNLRYAVYDTTGNVVTKGTYSSPPSLSPDGRKLALTQGQTVILHNLP